MSFLPSAVPHNQRAAPDTGSRDPAGREIRAASIPRQHLQILMLLTIDLPTTPAVATMDLVPREDLVQRTAAQAELKVMFSKLNRVAVQYIAVQEYTDEVAPGVLERLGPANLAPQIRSWTHPPEYKVVSAFLSCIPDPACRFTYLRVAFELGSETRTQARPIACTLAPTSSQDVLKRSMSVEISSELAVKVAKGGTKETLGLEHELYEYNITAHGRFSSTPTWDFRRTPVHPEIVGDLALLMVVASPAGSPSPSSLRISAQAELRSGSGLIPLVTRRREDDAATVAFTI
jgi:hypothetical protein